MVDARDEKLDVMVRASRRTLALLGCAAALLCATETFAQRYAPDGSVIPDAVLSPDQTPGDPALSPDAVRADPALSPDAVRPDAVLRPEDSQGGQALSPDAVPADAVLSPDAVRPDIVRPAD
jgi:hypothetical protein